MTEEDTFNRLKYPPEHFLMIEWDAYVSSVRITECMRSDWGTKREQFFLDRGWTWEKFFEARKKYLLETNS